MKKLCLTIGIVHLWAQVRLDKEAGEAGSHVVFAISSGVVWQRQGIGEILISEKINNDRKDQ